MHCTVHLHGAAVLSAFLRGLVSRTQSCVYNKRITPDLTLSLALFSFLQILLSGLPLYFVLLLLLLLFLYLSSKLIDSLHLVGFFSVSLLVLVFPAVQCSVCLNFSGFFCLHPSASIDCPSLTPLPPPPQLIAQNCSLIRHTHSHTLSSQLYFFIFREYLNNFFLFSFYFISFFILF